MKNLFYLISTLALASSQGFSLGRMMSQSSSQVSSNQKRTAMMFWGGSSSSNAQKRGVLVIGATGRTGRRIVETLSKQKKLPVTAGVRNLEKGQETFKKGDSVKLIDIDIVNQSKEELVDLLRAGNYQAVVCACGYSPAGKIDLLGPYKTDYKGTIKVVEAVIEAEVPKFVLISSLLTNGLEAGQFFNKNYLLLNLFGGILLLKNKAERFIMKSPLDWTIIRPGGLRESPPSGQIVYGKADTLYGGSVSRQQVAEVAVAAITSKSASSKVVEIVAVGQEGEEVTSPPPPKLSIEQGLASI